jgi:hypothetical protein
MSDSRAVRALTDIVAVEDYAPGMCRVVSWSDEYIIDLRGEGCACPDKMHNDAESCKHEYAAMLVKAEFAPSPYVSETRERTPVAADGGLRRPQTCECWGQDDVACWACYRSGFESPA